MPLRRQIDAIGVRVQTSGLSIEAAKAEQSAQLVALFKKHNTHPLYGLVMPFAQAPLLISMFFGLRSIGDYFPASATGGAYWFTDLTIPGVVFDTVHFCCLSQLRIPDESVALPVMSAFGLLGKWRTVIHCVNTM